jgi:hypothetical protein
MKQEIAPENKKNCPAGTPRPEKLFLVGGRYSTVHYPDRVSIVEMRSGQLNFANVHPLASIPVAKTMNDADACILALHWLRDNNYITADEYSHHQMDCIAASSKGQLKVMRHDVLEKMMAQGG